jgi:hypothetical protein
VCSAAERKAAVQEELGLILPALLAGLGQLVLHGASQPRYSCVVYLVGKCSQPGTVLLSIAMRCIEST